MAGTILRRMPIDPEPVVPKPEPKETLFDAKSNEFLVNNNVLSNYQHTEHISTTEPLYLDGMAGSDNIVHKLKRSGAKASFGDYLLSDLKTIVAQADLKDELKADVVGICIGQNPVNKKLVFWNVDSMTNANTYSFYTGAKFDATKFTTLSKGEGEPLDMGGYNLYVNRDVFGGEKGYIMATAPMSIEGPQSEQYIVHYGEFGGLQNTIEWYKQASAAGITFQTGSSEGEADGKKGSMPSYMPALEAIMLLSGVDSMDDDYNLWFLGSMGHISLLCGENELEGSDLESIKKYNALSKAVSNLGKAFMGGNFWSSSFSSLFKYSSSGHYLYFWSNEQGWGSDNVDRSFPLFALIEVPGAYVEPTFPDPYNGHEYVDLGLPSGTKWATMNVGANSETDYGLYFAWGETQGYADASTKTFSWSDYKFNPSGDGLTMTKYNETDGKIVLDFEDDAAYINWSGEWHMPNINQCEELLNTDYVTNTWVENYQNSGINGYLFTSVSNGNTMFIPAGGNCWGGEVSDVGEYGQLWSASHNIYSSSMDFGFNSERIMAGNSDCCYGFSVRGVVGEMNEIEDIPGVE